MKMVAVIAEQVADGSRTSAIISGPPGVGKTYAFEQAFKRRGLKYHTLRVGSAAALTEALCADPNGIFLFDECDHMFSNVDMLNILKIVTDTKSGPRILSHNVRAAGKSIPPTTIKARCVFLTNLDLNDTKRLANKRVGPHISAINSRCLPYVMSFDHERIWEYTVYLAVVEKMLMKEQFSRDVTNLALRYFTETMYRTHDVSPRRLVLIAREIVRTPSAWRDILEPTLERQPWSNTATPPVPQLPPRKLLALSPPPDASAPTRSKRRGSTAAVGKQSGAKGSGTKQKAQAAGAAQSIEPA